jgi:hypothetical protein
MFAQTATPSKIMLHISNKSFDDSLRLSGTDRPPLDSQYQQPASIASEQLGVSQNGHRRCSSVVRTVSQLIFFIHNAIDMLRSQVLLGDVYQQYYSGTSAVVESRVKI